MVYYTHNPNPESLTICIQLEVVRRGKSGGQMSTRSRWMGGMSVWHCVVKHVHTTSSTTPITPSYSPGGANVQRYIIYIQRQSSECPLRHRSASTAVCLFRSWHNREPSENGLSLQFRALYIPSIRNETKKYRISRECAFFTEDGHLQEKYHWRKIVNYVSTCRACKLFNVVSTIPKFPVEKVYRDRPRPLYIATSDDNKCTWLKYKVLSYMH